MYYTMQKKFEKIDYFKYAKAVLNILNNKNENVLTNWYEFF